MLQNFLVFLTINRLYWVTGDREMKLTTLNVYQIYCNAYAKYFIIFYSHDWHICCIVLLYI